MNARAWLWVGLGSLGAANLIVGGAWLGRDRLIAAGWLPSPAAARIDLPAEPLPPIGRSGSVVEAPDDSLPPPQTQLRTTQSAPVATCVALGPFETRDEASVLGQRIESAGGEVRIVEQSEVGEPDYFVYIEPAVSRALAHRTWRELVAQGIDAFVIPRGERENGVSVGVFTRRELAAAQRDRVSELGFAVAMRTVLRSHTVYLLQAWDPPAHAIAELAARPCTTPTVQADAPAAGTDSR